MTTESANTRRFWTIPNILTLVRFALIPIIIWLYMIRKAYISATIVVALSGLTDVVDGVIARKFNMVTDIGKIIDPIADKLTQATLIFCLSIRYKAMVVLFIAHMIKEVIMGVMGLIAIKHKSIISAKWFGKMSTIVLFFVTIIHLIFPVVDETFSAILVIVSLAVMTMALGMYIRFYFKLLHKKAN